METATTHEMVQEAVHLFSSTVRLAGKAQCSVVDGQTQYALRTFLEGTAGAITELLGYMDEVDLSCPAPIPEGATR